MNPVTKVIYIYFYFVCHSYNAYKISVRKPEGKKPLGRPRHRWKDNIKMDLKGKGYEGVDYIHVAQDQVQWWALARMAMNFWVP
jgi:hypothetical protein